MMVRYSKLDVTALLQVLVLAQRKYIQIHSKSDPFAKSMNIFWMLRALESYHQEHAINRTASAQIELLRTILNVLDHLLGSHNWEEKILFLKSKLSSDGAVLDNEENTSVGSVQFDTSHDCAIAEHIASHFAEITAAFPMHLHQLNAGRVHDTVVLHDSLPDISRIPQFETEIAHNFNDPESLFARKVRYALLI